MVTINPRPETNARAARAEAEAKLLTLKATHEGVKTLLQTGERSAQSAMPPATQPPIRAVAAAVGSMPRLGVSHVTATEAARAYASTAATSTDGIPIPASDIDEPGRGSIRLPDSSMPARPMTANILPMASAAITFPSLRATVDETTNDAVPGLTPRHSRIARSAAGSASEPVAPLLRPMAIFGTLLIAVIIVASALS